LLVVIVIIGILVAIALPNFIKIKDKAKEAEVKQNLHSIQLAIERYATDNDGNYPFYVFGGDARYNIGTINGINGGAGDDFWTPGPHITFDMFWLPLEPAWCYQSVGWGDLQDPELPAAFGDSVAYEGYMPKFPNNPFLEGNASVQYSLDALNFTQPRWACWGGFDGRNMFNTGYGSELNEIIKWAQRTEDGANILEFPGQFYYHTRWQDGVTNYGHHFFQDDYNPNSYLNAGYTGGQPSLNDEDDVSSLDVAGYDLVAYGSPRTKGQDLDNSVTVTGLFGGPVHKWRTGYLTLGQERNPYITTGLYPNVQDYDERPYSDSVYDFYIIHLGSGMDKKVGNPLDLNL
jgi:type II secretory pathway pseudopilin PulG